MVRDVARRAGDADIADRLRDGTEPRRYAYKVHLDGHNQLDYLIGAVDESPRQHFFYISDDGDLTAVRFHNWKLVFMEQRAPGTLAVWSEPYVELRAPKVFNLRTDPYERADITSNTYYDWAFRHAWLVVPIQSYVNQLASSLIEFPPTQEPASFTVAKVLAKLQNAMASS